MGRDQVAIIANEEDENETCHTPKRDENRIPQATAPPPPPRKQRKDHYPATTAAAKHFFQSPDVEAFFQSHAFKTHNY